MSAFLESLTGLSLLDPWMLALALLVPAALVVRFARGVPAARFAPAAFLADPPLPGSWRLRLRWLPRALQAAGLLVAALALSRPVMRTPIPLESRGIDILLCLDVSSSMSANDLDPRRSRLDVAREAARRFIAGRPDDRIGLLTFARFPDLLCPLTLDHAALETFLAGVAPIESDSPEDATGIGTAVARAAKALRTSAVPSKVAILLTDGEENVATAETPDEIAPIHAAQLCAELGVRVYAVAAGIGRRGPSGDWIPIDTEPVRRLAEKTGGRFFAARDASALTSVYARINDLEKVALEEPRFRIEERFAPFLAAALALFLLGRLLDATLFAAVP